jgi:hypothetical protein
VPSRQEACDEHELMSSDRTVGFEPTYHGPKPCVLPLDDIRSQDTSPILIIPKGDIRDMRAGMLILLGMGYEASTLSDIFGSGCVGANFINYGQTI